MKRPTLATLTSAIFWLGCSSPRPAATTDEAGTAPVVWRDASPHQARSVGVNGVRLSLLDWGGSGPPLVLIHGLGDSPHIFDDLAPRLTSDFRVVAYGRRGHAGSEKSGPYDNATLTEDLRQLLDSLRFDRVALLGWSMGGNEITEFARHHPNRVIGLVYLDAGYDWADPLFGRALGALPTPITPSPADQQSLDGLRAWFQRVWLPDLAWPAAWEAHLRDLVDVQADGSTRYRQTDSVNALMFESLVAYRKDFSKLAVPALSLWAPRFLPEPRDDTTAARKVAAWDRDYFAEYRTKSIDRFRTEVAGSVDSVLPNTSHASIGSVDPDGLARIIRSFLMTDRRQR